MGLSSLIISAFTKTVAALNPKPNINQGISSSDLQAYFDSSPEELRVKFNALIAALLAKGAAAELGIDSPYGNNVQAVLEYIISQGAGSLPPAGSIIAAMIRDGEITIPKLAFDPATQTELDNLHSHLESQISSSNSGLGDHIADATKHINIMTTKGDMIVQGASGPSRFAKGAAYKILGMDATGDMETWLDSLQSLMTSAGDMLYASSANSPARLAKGTDGQILSLESGIPAWEDKLNLAIGEGTDNSTTYNSNGSKTYNINLGVNAKRVRIVLCKGNNTRYFTDFVCNTNGFKGFIESEQASAGAIYGSNVMGGGGYGWDFGSGNISFDSMAISGTNLVLTLTCYANPSTLNIGWRWEAIY